MSKIRIELNRTGVASLMKSPEMMAICQEHASTMQRSLGDGYEISKYVGRNRVNVSVIADSKKARKKNSKENTLIKSMYRQKK